MEKKEYGRPLIIVKESFFNNVLMASTLNGEVGIQIGDDFWTMFGGEQ